MNEERRVTSNFSVEGARLIFKNFSGKGSQYNSEGSRNFGLLLSEEDAQMLAADGWNVKRRPPRSDDPERYEQPWLPVKVKFGKIPPIAVLIHSKSKIKLDEETIGQLDWTRIKNCDVIVRPYNYPASNVAPAGVAAYLKAIYVTVEEDAFEEKYADIPYAEDEEPMPFN